MLWTAEGGVVEIGTEEAPYYDARAQAMSADGNHVVGLTTAPVRAFRWTAAKGFRAFIDNPRGSAAYAVSGDGSRIVGSESVPLGARGITWTADRGVVTIGTFGNVEGFSEAFGVSNDGRYAVGRSMTAQGYYRAFRWSEAEGLQNLGWPFASGSCLAEGVSSDGSLVVGYGENDEGRFRSFVWTEAEGLKLLDWFDPHNSHYAFDTSNDGSIIVGAAIWTDGEPRRIHDVLEDDYGVSMEGWERESMDLRRCSADGTMVLGQGTYLGEPYQGFLAKLPLAPQIEGEVLAPSAPASAAVLSARATNAAAAPQRIQYGSKIRARVGQPIDLAFSALDPGGDALRFFAEGVPEGASIAPLPGDAVDASFDGTLKWTPTREDLGKTQFVHLYVRDVEGRRASLRFYLRGVPAVPPTVDPIVPVIVECRPGANRVQLQTRVRDVEGDKLVVTWRVDGKTKKTEAVAAGSLVKFEYAYPHGESVVDLEVSDDGDPVTASTTVTVQDTRDPIVVVAPPTPLAVERGELYALRSRLKFPTIRDACDDAPKVTHDAPPRLPVGKTVVTWKVRDASGNVATARQSVVVVNAPPDAEAGKDVRLASSAKRLQVRLNGRKSKDPDLHDLNYLWVAKGVRFDNPRSARPSGKFPIGTTVVTLTVVDEGGRRATDKVRVIVRNASVYRANAAAARVHAANAYEIVRRSSETRRLDPASAAAGLEASAACSLASYSDAEGAPESEGRAIYDAVRTRQSERSKRAAALLYGSYLVNGTEESLVASVEAYRSMLHAQMDLAD